MCNRDLAVFQHLDASGKQPDALRPVSCRRRGRGSPAASGRGGRGRARSRSRRRPRRSAAAKPPPAAAEAPALRRRAVGVVEADAVALAPPAPGLAAAVGEAPEAAPAGEILLGAEGRPVEVKCSVRPSASASKASGDSVSCAGAGGGEEEARRAGCMAHGASRQAAGRRPGASPRAAFDRGGPPDAVLTPAASEGWRWICSRT